MLSRDNPKTLYQQLREILIDSIESGKWQPDTKIPSENELAATYGMSRMSVRNVITDMVKEGYLYRVQGKGTYVSEKIIAISPYYVGIREQLEGMGYEVETEIKNVSVEPCGPGIAGKLRLKEGTPICRITRVRKVKGSPISIHISYINTFYSANLTKELLEKEQLCVLLNENYGLTRKRVEETLESVAASEEEAEYLGVEKGYPLLLLKDTLYSEEEIPYEYTKVIFRGDRMKIKLEFK